MQIDIGTATHKLKHKSHSTPHMRESIFDLDDFFQLGSLELTKNTAHMQAHTYTYTPIAGLTRISCAAFDQSKLEGVKYVINLN